MKVWIGGRDTIRGALNLYHPASRAGRVAKAVAAFCPETLASLVCRGAPDAATRARLDLVAAAIGERLGDDSLAVSVSPGTAGNHRKMTAQVSGRAGVIAYVKVADAPEVANLLDNEAAMLRWLAGKDLGPAVVPNVIGLDRADGLTLLLQGAPSASARPRGLAPDHKDAAFLSALMATGRKVVPLGPLFEAWRAPGREPADDTLETLGRDVQAALATVLPAQQVVVSVGHGDYAPWNCLDLSDGRLFVFDWEYGRKDAPLLGDLFHRVLMPAQLVQRAQPARLVCRLLLLEADPVLGDVVRRSGITRAELPGYLLLYLLQVAHRSRAQQGRVSPYIEGCLRTCLDTVNGAKRSRNVLVAAYACEPGKGSEPGVGWHMCQAISRTHKAWVITKDNNRAAIEAALTAQPNANLQFSYVGLPRWLTFWKKGSRGIRIYYYLWQFAAWREARRLGRRVDFDLAHHVTFVNDWLFSFLALLPYPFVWGPIGSHPRIPAALAPSLRSLLVDRLRCAVQSGFRLVDPLFWLCAYRASIIVGISPEVGRKLPLSLLGGGKFISYPAIGVENEFVKTDPNASADCGFRVLTMGRLVPFKGFHLAIRAFAKFARSKPDATLLVVGSGPERKFLENLVRSLRIDKQVEFRDWLPRQEAMLEMGHAHVFLFPSFEGGGMVILEAMAHGLPIVCLNYGGPGQMVRDECGVAVPIATLDDTVAKLAAALETLSSNEEHRLTKGNAAHRRTREQYLWENRVNMLNASYNFALQI